MWQTLSHEGRPYYYNQKTNKTQWEKPEELFTEEERNLASAGWLVYYQNRRPYWHNAKTQETRWEMPKVDRGPQNVTESHSQETGSRENTRLDSISGSTESQPRKNSPDSKQKNHSSNFGASGMVDQTSTIAPQSDYSVDNLEELESRKDLEIIALMTENGCLEKPYSEVLPLLIALDAFWELPTARERRSWYNDMCFKVRNHNRPNQLKALKRHLEDYQRVLANAMPITSFKDALKLLPVDVSPQEAKQAYLSVLLAQRTEEQNTYNEAVKRLKVSLGSQIFTSETDWVDVYNKCCETNPEVAVSRVLTEFLEESCHAQNVVSLKDQDSPSAIHALLLSSLKELKVDSNSLWQDILPRLERDLLSKVVAAGGPSPVQVFHAYVSSLATSQLQDQLASARTALAAKGLDPLGVLVKELAELVPKLKDPSTVLDSLRQERLSQERQRRRGVEYSEVHKLEY